MAKKDKLKFSEKDWPKGYTDCSMYPEKAREQGHRTADDFPKPKCYDQKEK